MAAGSRVFATNVAVLRTRAGYRAYAGLGIALVAVLIATAITAAMDSGAVTVATLLAAQRGSVALWMLDLMPFVFAFWGQYVGVTMAHEAGAMVLDQTQDLRARNTELEDRASREIGHDPLTGLAGRTLFLEHLAAAVEQAHAARAVSGVLVVDLNGFQEINEALGQHNGDRVLKNVARRLSGVAATTDRLARLSADTFALLRPHVEDRDALAAVARRIERSLSPPCAVENVSINLSASIGSAIGPDDALDAESLLNCAESAMHEAKRNGSQFLQYRRRSGAAGPQMLSLSTELRTAIDEDQFTLFLQPIVPCGDDRVFGAETLIRWQHPRRGLLPPAEFIDRAERVGIIAALTRWTLAHALTHMRSLAETGNPLQISVNLSARSLVDPSFPDMLAELLERHAVPGHRLTLELTEDTLLVDQARVRTIVEQVVQLGVQLSLDDFGTGYSQLAYLRRLPLAELKIDRTFVENIVESRMDVSIVESTIGLAHKLGLRVVGEGVTNHQQEQRLTGLGCDLMQGYYIGRPMPAESFPAWLDEWRGGWHTDTRVGRPYPVT